MRKKIAINYFILLTSQHKVELICKAAHNEHPLFVILNHQKFKLLSFEFVIFTVISRPKNENIFEKI